MSLWRLDGLTDCHDIDTGSILGILAFQSKNYSSFEENLAIDFISGEK
jgi:hypothetical protein